MAITIKEALDNQFGLARTGRQDLIDIIWILRNRITELEKEIGKVTIEPWCTCGRPHQEYCGITFKE